MKRSPLLVSIMTLSLITISSMSSFSRAFPPSLDSSIGGPVHEGPGIIDLINRLIDFSTIGAYVVCVDKTNKNQSEWLYRKDGRYQYLGHRWRSFKSVKALANLFYPNSDDTYYQSTWTLPVTQSQYSALASACKGYGSNYVPQPYSKHGYYLFAIVDPYRWVEVKLEHLQEGWVTPFWWNGASWIKSSPSYVTYFDPNKFFNEQ